MKVVKVKTDQLEALRQLHKLNDEQLAKKIGISTQTLKRGMSGENISAAFIAGACLYFRTPFESLFYATQAEQKIAA